MDQKTENNDILLTSAQMSGDGTQNNPFLISDINGLNSIRNNLSAYYRLTADLDLEGEVFAPIGSSFGPFKGTLDGNGHVIRNFKINSTTSYTGLFCYTLGATLKDLCLLDGEVVSSETYTGALVGRMNNGSVMRCSSNGSVTGKVYTGGLIGRAENNATVSDCYTLGTVISLYQSSYAGGLIGSSSSLTIRNCYSACHISEHGSGLVNTNGVTNVIDSYFDGLVVGSRNNNSYNIGKLTTALTNKSFFKNWDFINVWNIREGFSYPYLRCTGIVGPTIDIGAISDGTGTEENPYLINSVEGMECINCELSGHYKLMQNLDLKGENINPIGDYGLPFTGTFDGNGHIIRDFKISGDSYIGLFGYTRDATLKNLGLKNGEIKASDFYAGILAGYSNSGLVSGCSANGYVNGKYFLGGLIGKAENDLLVSDCYASGTVISSNLGLETGGLIGHTSSVTVRNCYAACHVSANGSGLIYMSLYTTVIDSYFDKIVAESCRNDSYNTGKLTCALTKKDFFENWDFINVWNIKEGISYPYLLCMEMTPEDIADTGVIYRGDGTENAPYIINSIEALNYIKYELFGNYRLATDLDLNGEFITPIGSSDEPFTGKFDGDGHIIKNFKINGSSYVGLFGRTKSAVLKRLCLLNGQITASSSFAGALAGYLDNGSVSECFADNSVTGSNDSGGLIGLACNESTITDCCTFGTVTASPGNSSATGGLVGCSYSLTIRNCYAACRVSKGGSGLVYVDKATSVIDSYFDSVKAGFGTSNSFNTGKLTGALVERKFLKDWDFDNIWNINNEIPYPYLRCFENLPKDIFLSEYIYTGAGTEEMPYLIHSVDGFEKIQYELSGYYKLVTDLNFNDKFIAPVDTSTIPFTGGLDGDGHYITNFKISATERYSGLFGFSRSAVFRNLWLDNAEVISTDSFTGVLAGYTNDCTFENICLSGSAITGKQYTGALTGCTDGGSFTGCFIKEDVTVKGTTEVGGLVGKASGNNVKLYLCCFMGNVTGNLNVGGLSGWTAGTISDCFVNGNVISTLNNSYTGGLAGYAMSVSIKNCYAACFLSSNGKGLATCKIEKVSSSYFDSDLAETTTPAEQARTTAQMFNKDTYIGWDWDSIWSYRETLYPALRNIEIISQNSFDLSYSNLTAYSVDIEWPEISGIEEYKLIYSDKIIALAISKISITGLTPDTEYEFRVKAKSGGSTGIWSKLLKIKTGKVLIINGLNCTGKGKNSITISWNPLDHVKSYKVFYNGNIQTTDTSTCTLTDLYSDIPYTIYVRALLTDGTTVTGKPIVEKIYTVSPQTEYARQFVEKCGQQTWFMDEIENLLNLKGKSINTINSQRDFTAIYAIDLTGRGISGELPVAIGELEQLRYLYLADNDLGGRLPEELAQLDRLIETDLSGNHFSE